MYNKPEDKPLSLYKFCMCLMLVAGGIIWICYGNSERLWYFSVGAVLLSYPFGSFFNSVIETAEDAMRENRRKIVKDSFNEYKENLKIEK